MEFVRQVYSKSVVDHMVSVDWYMRKRTVGTPLNVCLLRYYAICVRVREQPLSKLNKAILKILTNLLSKKCTKVRESCMYLSYLLHAQFLQCDIRHFDASKGVIFQKTFCNFD